MEQRLQVLDNVKTLLVSYSGLVIQMPDMFPQSGHALGPQQLVPKLKSVPDSAQGLPSEYLQELIARFNDDGLDMVSCKNKREWEECKLNNLMIQILGPAIAAISSELNAQNILGECKTNIQAFAHLCDNKAIATMITHLEEFNPDNVTAKDMELVSLLGPLFRLSAYPDAAVSTTSSSSPFFICLTYIHTYMLPFVSLKSPNLISKIRKTEMPLISIPARTVCVAAYKTSNDPCLASVTLSFVQIRAPETSFWRTLHTSFDSMKREPRCKWIQPLFPVMGSCITLRLFC